MNHEPNYPLLLPGVVKTGAAAGNVLISLSIWRETQLHEKKSLVFCLAPRCPCQLLSSNMVLKEFTLFSGLNVSQEESSLALWMTLTEKGRLMD